MGDSSPNFHWERTVLRQGGRCVGVDEVGRGCLAGPVVVAAVTFPDELVLQEGADLSPSGAAPWWRAIRDSKLLKPTVREELARKIWAHGQVQVAWCHAPEIDDINILRASFLAMRRALWPFQGLAQTVLVDGHLDPYNPKYGAPPGAAQRCGFQSIVPLVKGDQKSITIGAASIVAKVLRDQWMDDIHQVLPQYEFSGHKGYPTPVHKARLQEFGPSLVHRRTFLKS